MADRDVGMDVCANFYDSSSKVSGASFSALFSNVDNFRPEVYSDVISGVNPTGMGVKVHVKLGVSRSNRSRYIRLPHFVTNDDNDYNDAGRQTYENIFFKTPHLLKIVKR